AAARSLAGAVRRAAVALALAVPPVRGSLPLSLCASGSLTLSAALGRGLPLPRLMTGPALRIRARARALLCVPRADLGDPLRVRHLELVPGRRRVVEVRDGHARQ